jgi:RND superfamily putative drug exporter
VFRLLANLAHNRPRRVVAVAVAGAVTAGALGSSVAGHLHPYGAEDPASDSVKARNFLEGRTGYDPRGGLVFLLKTRVPVLSPAGKAKVARLKSLVGADPAVRLVVGYFETGRRDFLSRDGRSTYLAAFLKPLPDKQRQEAAKRLERKLARAMPDAAEGGRVLAEVEVNRQVEHDLKRAEMLAFPLLFLLSFLFFRGLVAALLPPLVGGLAILSTLLGLRIASELTPISIFALNLMTGLGLGLAIDYSLFIVSRYREELARVGPGREAILATLQTAGRTVLFSSLTVAAALASLLIFPQRFLYSMGIGGSMVALIACFVALVILPAVLVLLGERVNALSPKRLQSAALRDARPASSGGWYRLSRTVMRRPVAIAVASASMLIALGIPFLSIKFTSVDVTVLPHSAGARAVDDRLRAEFPPTRSRPIYLALKQTPDQLGDFRRFLARLSGVAAVSPVQPAGSDASRIDVIPKSTHVYSGESQSLVRAIRRDVGPQDHVGGDTAEFIDTKKSLADHLPIAFSIIVASTTIVLFLMTGSIVLPLKALLMNVLGLSAAFGILVLIFQDGRLEDVLKYSGQGALEATQPVLLFAVAFGLSTDYGVFLLSRIKEARDRGASDTESVAMGLERTGRIVTAAALLFCVAIGAFATSKIIFIKEVGIGTALAVLIDATLIRALLVPSLMELLGRLNWWAPLPLRRLHRRIGLSETETSESVAG